MILSEFGFWFFAVSAVLSILASLAVMHKHGQPHKPYDATVSGLNVVIGFIMILILLGAI